MEVAASDDVPFLDALDQADRAVLLDLGRRRHVRRGATLFSEGDRADAVHLLVTGRVKIVAAGIEGRDTMLAVRGPGDLIGELSVIDGAPRSAAAVAIDDLEVVAIPRDALLACLAGNGRVALALLGVVSRRLRDADLKRVEFAQLDTLGRVAARLLELADRFGEEDQDRVRIALALSQEELAGWTGSSREAVAKALRVMRERAWVETGRREILLLDVRALRRRVGLG